MHIIDLVPADHDRQSYGIVLQSKMTHSITGSGVHNRSFQHLLQVWMNDGVDPRGYATEDDLSFLFSAQASVIALHPLAGPERGPSLAIGDTLQLRVGGRKIIGTFEIVAGRLSDPYLERL